MDSESHRIPVKSTLESDATLNPTESTIESDPNLTRIEFGLSDPVNFNLIFPVFLGLYLGLFGVREARFL